MNWDGGKAPVPYQFGGAITPEALPTADELEDMTGYVYLSRLPGRLAGTTIAVTDESGGTPVADATATEGWIVRVELGGQGALKTADLSLTIGTQWRNGV